MKLILPLLIGGGGLWLLSRAGVRGPDGRPPPSDPTPGGGAGSSSSPGKPGGDVRFTGTGVGNVPTTAVPAGDVAPPDLEATQERDVFLDDFPLTDDQRLSWNDRFNRQVSRPAQKLNVADLTADDFNRAIALLDGTLAPPSRENMSDRQGKAADLTAADALGNTLYNVWHQIMQYAGAFTFGITTAVGAIVDASLSGQLTDLNKEEAASKIAQGSLSGTDMARLKRWLGPVMVVGGRNPGSDSDWADGAPLKPPPALDTASDGSPVYRRFALFSSGASGWYLRWTSDDITAGKTFRERVNIRARMYYALDVIACQLFPYPDPYDATVPDQAGLHTYYNAAYKGPSGKGSGWLKGSVFLPHTGDITIAGIQSLKKAEGTAFVDPSIAIAAAGKTALSPPPPTTVGGTLFNPPTQTPFQLMDSGSDTVSAPVTIPTPVTKPPVVVRTPKPIGDGDTVHPIGKPLP